MATSFVAVRVGRLLAEDMFADLGFPIITFLPAQPYGWQIDLVDDLTLAQIQRAKIRLATKNTAQETLYLAAMNAVADLDVILGYGARTNAQNTTDIKMLAQDVKGIIRWLGKDVL